MAIGPIHVEWLSWLARSRVLPRNASVLDLGPQDVQTTRSYLAEVAARHLTPAEAARAVEGVFDEENPLPTGQAAFYSIFGATDYVSLDLAGTRATHAHDLNLPGPSARSFRCGHQFRHR
jgi:hypothetical protein